MARLPDDLDGLIEGWHKGFTSSIKAEDSNYGEQIAMLFNDKNRKNTIFLWMAWCMLVFIQQGIWYVSPLIYEEIEESEDLFEYFIGAVGEVSSVVIAYLMIESWLGRVGSMAIGGLILCFGNTAILFTDSHMFPHLSNISRFGVNIAFNVLFLFTSEVYEVALRGLGTGMATSFLEIGAFMMPFVLIPMLPYFGTFSPFWVLSVLGGLFFLIHFLPSETRNKAIL